ncbi:O-antigen ligase family protein [Acuticoccus kandeliae]|uniref:O-antigen ligase family protein n=1 Tax=Acuticoccus kandeliae TaxID=2073160 RepID=UPI00130065FF|nr:O-antigen ligase family protein [Acuticoccus kandeliae]
MKRPKVARPAPPIVVAQGFLGWAALVVAAFNAVPLGGNYPLGWLWLALASAILFTAQLILDIVERPKWPALAALLPVVVLYLIALCWGAIQLSSSVPEAWVHESWRVVGVHGSIAIDPDFGRNVLARLAAYAMLFWVAVRASADRHRARRFVAFFAVWSVILAAYGILTIFVGANWLAGTLDVSGTLTSTFVNRNSYATYAGFGLIANLAMIALSFEGFNEADYETNEKLTRAMLERLLAGAWFYTFGTVMVAAALILTVSRGGIIATLGGTAIFVLTAWRFRGLSLAAVAPVVIFGGLILVYVGALGLSALFGRLLNVGSEARFVVFPAIMEAILERPLLGYGPGGFEDGFRPFVPEGVATGEWNYAHNTYLENFFDFGIPASLIFFAALGLIGLRLLNGTQIRQRSVPIPAFALGVFAVATLHSAVDFSLQMPATAAIFAFILGLGWSQSFSSRGMV